MLKLRQPFNTERKDFQALQLVPALLCLVAIALALRMRFRIEKATDMHKTIISVSGPLQSEHLDALHGDRLPVALDLEDVTLVDIDVI